MSVVLLPNQLTFPWWDDGAKFLPFKGEGGSPVGLGEG